MDPNPIDFSELDQVFRGFRIATLVANEPNYGEKQLHAIGVKEGKIVWIGLESEIPSLSSTVKSINGNGQWLTPGLIDCHTHLVYGGNRADEWEARLGGKSYEEIARAGGGILASLRATRLASESELFESAKKRLRSLMAEGVTTVEIKSGYGLDVETELKMLRVANRLGSEFAIDVEPTLLGAHAVPPEFKGNPDKYIELVCQEMIPAAQSLCTAVDAFCESIAFDVSQVGRVFDAAASHGLKFKVHAEQLTNMGMAAEAARRGALSADHLEYLTPNDCQVMGQHSTVATLLPGAFYCLCEKQKPPVATLIENQVPIAIATDSNPGSSPVVSLLLMGNMACNLFRLTPEMAMAGITRNAAAALGKLDSIGTIEIGKNANFAIWDVVSLAEIFYQIGGNPCTATYHHGTLRSA